MTYYSLASCSSGPTGAPIDLPAEPDGLYEIDVHLPTSNSGSVEMKGIVVRRPSCPLPLLPPRALQQALHRRFSETPSESPTPAEPYSKRKRDG